MRTLRARLLSQSVLLQACRMTAQWSQTVAILLWFVLITTGALLLVFIPAQFTVYTLLTTWVRIRIHNRGRIRQHSAFGLSRRMLHLCLSPFHRCVISCGPSQLSVSSHAPSLSLTVSPLCRFLRTRPAVCLIARSISVSHRLTVVLFLADPVVSSVGQLGLCTWCGAVGSLCWFICGVRLLGLSLLVYLWCGAAGSLSTGLFVVWGCWFSLYWSTGGVGLLVLSLLVYWWCGTVGSLYWSTGGVGLLVLSLLVYWWCGAVGSLSTGLLVVWGCLFSLLVYWWCGAVGSLYWSTGGVGLLVFSTGLLWCGAVGSLSTGLLVVWDCWFSLLDYWWCGAVGSLYWSIGGVRVTVYWWSRSADLIDSL